jgi:hypothetical protein
MGDGDLDVGQEETLGGLTECRACEREVSERLVVSLVGSGGYYEEEEFQR